MNRIFIVFCLLISATLHAQNSGYDGYNWNTFPELTAPDTVKPVNGSLITMERRITEVYLNKEDLFEEIYVFHRKIRVESHDAINSFNKIYVPVSNVIEVIAIKARFISKTGRITDVPKESIRQVENLENKGDFQTFAIEGAESGGEIEYYYTLRRKFNPYGSVMLQGSVPISNLNIIYTFPQELEYLFKPYNGCPQFEVSLDSTTGMKSIKATIAYIAGIQEEPYSAYNARVMRYEYTLTHNHFTGVLRIYSFSKVASNMYSTIYSTTNTEKTAVKNALKKIPLSGKSDFDRVKSLENWLKTGIVITEELPGTPSIDEMLKTRQTTEFGMTRLLIAFLTEMSIEFETVLSCDQSEKAFDPEFNGWNYLDDFIVYFPQFNAVILPENPTTRLGLIPSSYQASYGLFLHPVSYGKMTTLAYDVKKLPADNYMNNTDSLLINLKLNLDEMNLDAAIHRAFSGELASSFQTYWKLFPADRKEEMVRSLFDMGNQNTTIGSYEVTNAAPEDIAARPFIWDVHLTANSLIEQAGEDIIVKIGEVIGEQSELYQQNTRKLPVYVGSLHSYHRRIEFEIPEGYSVSNPENLKIKVEMKTGNRVSSAFTSDYKIEGKKIIILSNEFYSELEYPLEEFEAFRNIINAAADFNKKTLLLTRRSL